MRAGKFWLVIALVAFASACSSGSGQDTQAGTESTSAAEIIAGFAEAGLPIGDQVIYDENSDPNDQLGRPGSYIAKGAWIDTRIEECFSDEIGWDCGGDVEVFDDAGDMRDRFEYLGLFANDPPIGGYYMWKSANAIVRVGFALTPTEAADYENALRDRFGSVDAYEE